MSAKYGLSIKWKKCSFLEKRISFKIWLGKEKTQAVQKCARTKNIKDILRMDRIFSEICTRVIARQVTNLLFPTALEASG